MLPPRGPGRGSFLPLPASSEIPAHLHTQQHYSQSPKDRTSQESTEDEDVNISIAVELKIGNRRIRALTGDHVQFQDQKNPPNTFGAEKWLAGGPHGIMVLRSP